MALVPSVCVCVVEGVWRYEHTLKEFKNLGRFAGAEAPKSQAYVHRSERQCKYTDWKW